MPSLIDPTTGVLKPVTVLLSVDGLIAATGRVDGGGFEPFNAVWRQGLFVAVYVTAAATGVGDTLQAGIDVSMDGATWAPYVRMTDVVGNSAVPYIETYTASNALGGQIPNDLYRLDAGFGGAGIFGSALASGANKVGVGANDIPPLPYVRAYMQAVGATAGFDAYMVLAQGA